MVGWEDVLLPLIESATTVPLPLLECPVEATVDARLRDLEDFPLEEEDQASELVGGGGTSCATTVA